MKLVLDLSIILRLRKAFCISLSPYLRNTFTYNSHGWVKDTCCEGDVTKNVNNFVSQNKKRHVDPTLYAQLWKN